MAIWQVGFFVLPQKSIDKKELFKVSEEHTFDDSPYWQEIKLNIAFFHKNISFLRKSNSWSKDLTLLGDENSNRFEILSENDIVESVSFRIDFTSDYEHILRQIIEFCMVNDLIIVDENLNLVPLNFEQAKKLIESAPQVKKYNHLLGFSDYE